MNAKNRRRIEMGTRVQLQSCPSGRVQRAERDLRRSMRRGQLTHLARVADIAAKKLPELSQKFVLAPMSSPYLAFRTAARSMAAAAQSRKELLVQHGLADTVLDSLVEALDEFDRAIERGSDGRREHVGASAELAESFAAWESASNTLGPARSSGIEPAPAPSEPPSSGGEIKPAA